MDVINKILSDKLKSIGVNDNDLSLSQINNILSYYIKYFKVYRNKNTWKINKSIFKIYFLNHTKRKYMNEFIKISNEDYKTEVDAKGEILYFLIKSEFIDVNDINNI